MFEAIVATGLPGRSRDFVRVGLAGSRLAGEAGHIALLVGLGQAFQAPLRRGFFGHGRCSSIVLYPAMLAGRAARGVAAHPGFCSAGWLCDAVDGSSPYTAKARMLAW